MKKNILITVVTLFGIFSIVAVSSVIYLLTRSTEGIPHGIYFQLDEEEALIKDGNESGWSISSGKAEHRYLIYKIVNIDDKLYFEIMLKPDNDIFRYEARFDRKTKVLSVDMPSNQGNPYHIPSHEMGIKTFRFKKTGISIG